MNVKEKALTYLAKREYSKKELETKLSSFFTKEEIQETLIYLEEKNFLSDSRYCKAYISSRLRKTPEGKELIILRLKSKGIESSMARNEVNEYFSENASEINDIYSRYTEKILRLKGLEKGKLFLFKKQIRVDEVL